MTDIQLPFSVKELMDLIDLIEASLSDVPTGVQLAFKYACTDSPIYTYTKDAVTRRTNILRVPDDHAKVFALMTASLEDMPLYVNDSHFNQITAKWRMELGK